MNEWDKPSTSKQDITFEDDEIFEDSAFLANFDNTSFKQTGISANNLDNIINTSALNVSALCCDEEISGYDKLTGETWIYPTNYPVRDYQFNIIKAALLKNTLVSLPTGLGKTFIAAVIMYNFYRWYPLGKIVFTAPTRPLVAQQIDACYNIIAIPPNDTIEMTGHMQVNTRKAHWQTKRVFFATPQVIYNDIKSGICPADKIRCLVIDEAHKARGNYAYCQIVATLDEMGHKTYRMLALSATPGSKVEDVINVVKSLHIAHLELRTENCIDVAPYSHSRKITTEIVKLGSELTHLWQQYVEILDFYARRLKQFNILPQNLGNLSKGRIVMLYKEFQTRDHGSRHPQHNHIMKDFTLLIALYHGLELLVKHGSRVFLNFFDEHPEKTWIQADNRLTGLLERLRDDLGVNPLSLDRSILPDGTVPEMPKDLCFGHPKFDKLKSIIVDHFTRAKQINQDTRAIIFCEYRESVNLVHCLLLQCRPLVTPQMFVGQGASGKDGKTVVSQKQQLRVMRGFREGACNTLVATCVAEEGLDVGSVDLIVCFDISTTSPIRLVQRCGRTGRERGGQVYILVTEGREHQTLIDCMRQRDGLNKKILQSKEVNTNLYQSNPRMMPRGVTPLCHKMFITVDKKLDKDKEKTNKKGQKSLRTMLLNGKTKKASPSSKDIANDSLITDDEFKELFPSGYRERKAFKRPENLFSVSIESIKTQATLNQDTDYNLSKWLEWQRTLHETVNIDHSKDTEFLVNILQKCDFKRLEPPQDLAPKSQELSQHISPMHTNQMQSPLKPKQTKKKQKVTAKVSPAKNYGDIRALFCTTTKSTKNYTKLINDLGVQNDDNVSTSLINLLVDLNLNVDSTITTKDCYICRNICDCKTINKQDKSDAKSLILLNVLGEPILPDLDLIDDINVDMMKNYISDAKKDQFDVMDTTLVSQGDKQNSSANFSLEFDLEALEEMNSPKEQLADHIKSQNNTSTDKNFDIGGIDDIFDISSPEEALATGKTSPKEEIADNALNYFGLDSLEDIFADYEDDQEPSKAPSPILQNSCFIKDVSTKTQTTRTPEITCIKQNVSNKASIAPFPEINVPNSEYPLSPSILSGRQKLKDIPTSPILNSQLRKHALNNNNKIPQSSTPNGSARKRLSLALQNNAKDEGNQKSLLETTDKSMFTITQLVEMINKTQEKSIIKSDLDVNKNVHKRSTSPILLTQSDRKRNLTNSSTNKDDSTNKCQSLIILSSDSDSNDYEDNKIEQRTENNVDNKNKAKQISSPVVAKRKFQNDDEITASPHFNKKPKLNDEECSKKSLTVQEKILAAISSNKTALFSNNPTNLHCTVAQPFFPSQKENLIPRKEGVLPNSPDKKIAQNPLDLLQKYRKEERKFNLTSKSPKKSPIKKCLFEDFTFDEKLFSPKSSPKTKNSPLKKYTPVKRNIYFGESDDDFNSPVKPGKKNLQEKSPSNRRRRKRSCKANSLLDLEASVSGEDASDDSLSDSGGSIASFICDSDVTADDIHAVYMKSVKSPIRKNGFKIPELSNKYKRHDIFSQVVEDDAYEMDSFCVDSEIGLTQITDASELDLAEIVLEKKRRSKKRIKRRSPSPQNGDSPIIRKTKNCKRQINSDSDSD